MYNLSKWWRPATAKENYERLRKMKWRKQSRVRGLKQPPKFTSRPQNKFKEMNNGS